MLHHRADITHKQQRCVFDVIAAMLLLHLLCHWAPAAQCALKKLVVELETGMRVMPEVFNVPVSCTRSFALGWSMLSPRAFQFCEWNGT
jgi:hypothetical protein